MKKSIINITSLFCVSAMLALSVHRESQAGIIAVLTDNSAQGLVGNRANTESEVIELDNQQVNTSFGSSAYGSAARFDSDVSLNGDKISFMNGNAALGVNSVAKSRTVVDVSFENTSNQAVRPTFKSQILAAGMGIYLSDCPADDLLGCGTTNDVSSGFHIGENWISPPGTDERFVKTQFNFSVESADQVLFSLMGNLTLVISSTSQNIVELNFGTSATFLKDFRVTSSPADDNREVTVDWNVTDFEVLFPVELTLDPGEIGSLRYITEVTSQSSGCLFGDCAVAYGMFGDPIARGGIPGSRPNTRVQGIQAGQYELAAAFDNDTLSLLATSGPGVNSTSVPGPAPLSLLLLGTVYLAFSRNRHIG